jgi:hypothetical protein
VSNSSSSERYHPPILSDELPSSNNLTLSSNEDPEPFPIHEENLLLSAIPKTVYSDILPDSLDTFTHEFQQQMASNIIPSNEADIMNPDDADEESSILD